MLSLWLPRFVMLVTILFAARKGGEPERLVASILLATFGLDVVNHALFGDPAWFAVNPGHLVIDGWAFITLLWVALRANRGWPLWVTASQVIVVLGHIAKLWDVDIVLRAYWAMTQVPFTFQLVVLLIGTYAHQQRALRIGQYHSWRPA
ncbi:MAG: hypothetical protein B7Z39_00925 [Novosphingobium sp. 12-64-8]|nr:MAG: hypothetical protein B7Z39_00925 [Novosphingobium sp. 12-64-8]